MQMLETEPGSSTRAANASNCQATSPAPFMWVFLVSSLHLDVGTLPLRREEERINSDRDRDLTTNLTL